MMQYRFKVPHSLELYRLMAGKKVSLCTAYKDKDIPAEVKEVFTSGIEKMLYCQTDEVALKVTFEGEEFYILVKDIDTDLLNVCTQWSYLRGKDRIEAADREYEKVMPLLRKYLKANLQLVSNREKEVVR